MISKLLDYVVREENRARHLKIHQLYHRTHWSSALLAKMAEDIRGGIGDDR